MVKAKTQKVLIGSVIAIVIFLGLFVVGNNLFSLSQFPNMYQESNRTCLLNGVPYDSTQTARCNGFSAASTSMGPTIFTSFGYIRSDKPITGGMLKYYGSLDFAGSGCAKNAQIELDAFNLNTKSYDSLISASAQGTKQYFWYDLGDHAPGLGLDANGNANSITSLPYSYTTSYQGNTVVWSSYLGANITSAYVYNNTDVLIRLVLKSDGDCTFDDGREFITIAKMDGLNMQFSYAPTPSNPAGGTSNPPNPTYPSETGGTSPQAPPAVQPIKNNILTTLNPVTIIGGIIVLALVAGVPAILFMNRKKRR